MAIDFDLINRTLAARDLFNSHFDGCRTCGTGAVGLGLCAAGRRLHNAYAALKNSINRH